MTGAKSPFLMFTSLTMPTTGIVAMVPAVPTKISNIRLVARYGMERSLLEAVELLRTEIESANADSEEYIESPFALISSTLSLWLIIDLIIQLSSCK